MSSMKLRPREPRVSQLRTADHLWGLAKRIYSEFFDDRIPTVAGGITFFVLLGLFPAISAVVSLYGMFASSTEITRDVDLISGFLPGGAVSILRAELHRLGGQKHHYLNLAFAVSLVLAMWSASGGFTALVEGLNVAFEVRETRSFLRQIGNAMLFTAAGVAFGTLAVEIGHMFSHLENGSALLRTAAHVLVWPFLFGASTTVLAIVYRFGPDRHHPKWRWTTWGSSIASILWILGTQLFTWYVQNFGSYNRIYGELGAVVGFLTWVWLSLVILLLGAEINCELERDPGAPRTSV
jgi:membrane protein